MLGYLEQLKKEPEHKRRKAAFVMTAVITAVIAMAWGIVLGFRLGGSDFSFKVGDTLDRFKNITGSSTSQVQQKP